MTGAAAPCNDEAVSFRQRIAPLAVTATFGVCALAAGFVLTPPAVAGLDNLVPRDGHAAVLINAKGRELWVESSIRRGSGFAWVDPQISQNLFNAAVAEGAEHDVWVVEHVQGTMEFSTYSSLSADGRSAALVIAGGMLIDYPEGRLDSPSIDVPRWRDFGPVIVSTSSGAVEGEFSLYATAETDSTGCRTAQYVQTITIGGMDTVLQWTERRCPGEGLVGYSDNSGSWTVVDEWSRSTPITSPVNSGPPTHPTEVVRLIPPDEMPYLGTSRGGEPIGHDRVVLAVSLSEDIVSLDRDGDVLSPGWVAHPGGHISAFGTFGEVALAATTQRQAVAYDADGLRLWEAPLPEVCTAGPVRLDDSTAVLGCRDGSLHALDIATGAIQWTYKVPGDVAVAPLVSGEIVYVVDLSNQLTAIQAGEELWSIELAATPQGWAIPLNGGALFVSNFADEEVLRFDPATGESLGVEWVGDSGVLVPFEQGVAISLPAMTVSLGHPNAISYAGPVRSLTSSAGALIVDTGTSIEVAGPDGVHSIGPILPAGSVFTLWVEGDGEWILTDGMGSMWSVR